MPPLNPVSIFTNILPPTKRDPRGGAKSVPDLAFLLTEGQARHFGRHSALPGALRSDVVQAIERDAQQVLRTTSGREIRRVVNQFTATTMTQRRPTAASGVMDRFRRAVNPPLMGPRRSVSSALDWIVERARRTPSELGGRFRRNTRIVATAAPPRASSGSQAAATRTPTSSWCRWWAPVSAARHQVLPCPLLRTPMPMQTRGVRRAAGIHAAISAVSYSLATTLRDMVAARRPAMVRHNY